MTAAAATLRDNVSAALVARILLQLVAILCAAGAAWTWLNGFAPPGPEDMARLGFQLVQFLVLVVSFVVTLRWIYLAHVNARAFGADDMMGSPGWAVGWFFVPFANLVMPFLMMRELWKASAQPGDWQAASAPATLLLWWLLSLASNITSAISAQMGYELGADAARGAEYMAFASDVLAVPAMLLLAWIIGRIQSMQDARRRLAVGDTFA